MKKISRKLSLLSLAASAALWLSSCGTTIGEDGRSLLSRYEDVTTTTTTVTTPAVTTTTPTVTTPATTTAPPEPEIKDSVVHLCCAGDNLIHDNIYVEARQADGSYDFTPCYEPCKKLLEGADLAIIDQETLVNSAFPPTSYPEFSTPTEAGDAIIDLGFNAVSLCNNHVLDMGSTGLISSLDYWDSKGIIHYGAYRDEADSNDFRLTEINGITFAFLGYMEHTNGIYLPQNGPGKVIYLSDEAKIKEQIQAANEKADVVIVSCHYGTEVENDLNEQQITLTPKLVDWGADIIIGTQAHALSPCNYIDRPDGSKAFVFYGLGNFFSTMYGKGLPDGQHGRSLVGIFGSLDVRKSAEDGKITIENVKATPVISHFEGESFDSMWYNCKVYPMADYTDELLEKHFLTSYSGITREELEGYLKYIPEEFLNYK